MTEPKFTKGPWLIKMNKTFYGEEFIGIYDTQDRLTASAYMHIANANLIAAAPDMYEALEEVSFLVCATCSKYERYCESGNRLLAEMPCNICESKVFKALRKARGEEE